MAKLHCFAFIAGLAINITGCSGGKEDATPAIPLVSNEESKIIQPLSIEQSKVKALDLQARYEKVQSGLVLEWNEFDKIKRSDDHRLIIVSAKKIVDLKQEKTDLLKQMVDLSASLMKYIGDDAAADSKNISDAQKAAATEFFESSKAEYARASEEYDKFSSTYREMVAADEPPRRVMPTDDIVKATQATANVLGKPVSKEEVKGDLPRIRDYLDLPKN